MAAPTQAVRKLVTRKSVMRASLTATLVNTLKLLWRSFDGWEDKDKVEALAARSASLVDAAVKQERLQVRAFLDTYFKMNGDFDIAEEQVPELAYEYPRQNITALEVYKRPAREYGYHKGTMLRVAEQLKDDLELADREIELLEKSRPSGSTNESFSESLRKALEDFDTKRAEADAKRDKVLDLITTTPFTEEDITQEAIERGIARLEKLANTDIQLARRDETTNVLDYKSKVIGYRRVVHPELSESGTCGMCIVAATRWYTIEHLEPIHMFCKCETLPVTGDSDPGKTLNDEDIAVLDQTYTDAGGNSIDYLSDTRYRVNKNSETGWELVESKTSGEPAVSASLRRSKQKPQLVRSRTELKMLKSNNDALQERYEAGETELAKSIDWSDKRISEVESYIKELVRLKAAETLRLARKAESDAKRQASIERIRKEIAANK